MRNLLSIGLVVFAACSSRGEVEDDKDIISNTVGDWSTSLSPVNNSGVRGSAGAQSVGVGTGARVSIEGAMANGHHPWHVHFGRCGSGGGIVGSANAYPVLHVGADGRASANATVDVALQENREYHVNVHRSPTELSTIIACGNLEND